MHETVHSSTAPTAAVVTLDDCLVEVPRAIAGSLTDVCELLERMAIHSGCVLTNVMIDGANHESIGSFRENTPFSRVEAKTVSFHAFAGAATRRLETRLNDISATVEETILLVLINHREFARAAWQNWLGELRAILIECNFLEELADSPPAHHRIAGHTIERHWEALHTINALAEVLLADDLCPWESGQAAAFSTVCEHHFLVWLNRLRRFFAQATKYYVHHDEAE
ncbi:MAG: hypothetical protein HY043_09760 [Verrucomicrobia bacterium]|nr:hypothetical protein [Verrucomicrobiota bacterium]